jgi:hypothetical protein
MVLEAYSKSLSTDVMESQFWNGAKSGTKTTVAGLTANVAQASVGAAEKTYVAAAPTTLFDGIVTKLIYDRSAVGKRWKVAGTTINSTNIQTEYDKLYAAISSATKGTALLIGENAKNCYIYAPYSHITLINIYNNNGTNRSNFFVVDAQGNYSFNGVQIKFVPLPENCMIFSRWSDLVWGCDLAFTGDGASDGNLIKMKELANNSEDWFIKIGYTQSAGVYIPQQKVLYLG